MRERKKIGDRLKGFRSSFVGHCVQPLGSAPIDPKIDAMPPTTCPDRQSLQRFLLGKTPVQLSGPLEEHLAECASCATAAQTLSAGDDLTQAIARGAEQQNRQTPDDEVALRGAIEQAKRFASQLDTHASTSGSTAIITGSKSVSVAIGTQEAQQEIDFLAPAEQPDELGRLGDYRVLKVLGVGGMGMVFKAEDLRLGRLVALKVMLPRVAVKPQAKERFLREARATAAIAHDHVVQIHQVGEDRGVPFIAMQYLQGQSLQTAFGRIQKIRPKDVARIGKEVALGLAAAHEKGLIHRDIKPDNIWIEAKTRRVKILDFGLARNVATDEGLTQSGTILGTPRYMAPEQVSGGTVDHRADLFSLGSMLYHLAAGKPAFEGDNIPALLYAITQSAPQPVGEVVSKIHPELAAPIMRLLSKDPENRPQSAEEVAKQFASVSAMLQAPVANAAAPIAPIVTAQPKRSPRRRPPNRRWPLVAAAGAAAFALLLGVIVITIEGPDGKETTIRVPEGTTTTLELASGSKATIEELSKQPGVATEKNADQAASQTPVDRRANMATNRLPPLRRLGTWDEGPPPPWFGEGGHDAGYSIIGSDVLPGIVERPTKLPSIRRWNVDTKWGRGITFAAHHSPDGNYFATGNSDGHVRIFDAGSMDLVSLLPGKTTISGVEDLSWAPDSQRLVVAIPNENVARIWSIEGRLLVEENTDVRCHSVAWSPNGKWIAEGYHARIQLRRPDGTIDKVLCEEEGSGPSVGGMLAWHPDGQHLASWQHDGRLVLWDCQAGTSEPLREPVGHRGFPGHRMAWSGSGMLAVALGDRLEIYGPDRTLKQTVDYRGRGAIAWHPDDDRLFMWDGDSVRSWSVQQKTFVDKTLDASSGWPHQPLALSCSPDGERLVIVAGLLRELSSDLRTKFFETPIYCRYGTSVSWSFDGKYLASTTEGFHSGIPIWNELGEAVQTIPVALETLPLKLTWSPTEWTLVGTGQGQPSVISRDLGPATVLSGAEDAYSVAWSPDGSQLAFGTGNGTVKIFASSGRQITEMIAGDRPAFVAWSGANDELWVHCGHRLYRCRPQNSWTLALIDETAEAAVTSPSWYPNGDLIAIQNTGCYSRDGKLVTGPSRPRPVTWRHDGNAYVGAGQIHLKKYSRGGDLTNTRHLNGFFGHLAYQYQPFGGLFAVSFNESEITMLNDEGFHPYLHIALLPDMKSATFSAAGEMIDGDPAIVDRYLTYYFESEEGRIETLGPVEFRKRFTDPSLSRN